MGKMKIVFTTTSILAICALLPSCSSKTKLEITWESFTQSQIEWKNLLNQDSEIYLVFVYSESCGHCKAIKNDVLSFASAYTFPKIWPLPYDSSIPFSPYPELTIGASNIEDVWIYAIPTMIEIENGIVKNNVYGEDDILSLLYSYKI